LTNKQKLKRTPVKLKESQKRLVKEIILAESKRINQKICAFTICSDHIHIVAESCSESISQIVQRYKRVSTYALQKNGFNSKVLTKGYDKRYCFSIKDLKIRINYVLRHD